MPHRPTAFRATLFPCMVVVLASIGGCRTGLDAADVVAADGVRCGLVPGAAKVFIEVRYDAQGLPSASPETCEIPSGATVTWRGPAGDGTPFEIAFKAASPVSTDPRGVLGSTKRDDRQVVRRRMDGAPGRYDYGIRANGRELDPAIIIH